MDFISPPTGWVLLLLYSFYRWENQSVESLSNLLKIGVQQGSKPGSLWASVPLEKQEGWGLWGPSVHCSMLLFYSGTWCCACFPAHPFPERRLLESCLCLEVNQPSRVVLPLGFISGPLCLSHENSKSLTYKGQSDVLRALTGFKAWVLQGISFSYHLAPPLSQSRGTFKEILRCSI